MRVGRERQAKSKWRADKEEATWMEADRQAAAMMAERQSAAVKFFSYFRLDLDCFQIAFRLVV